LLSLVVSIFLSSCAIISRMIVYWGRVWTSPCDLFCVTLDYKANVWLILWILWIWPTLIISLLLLLLMNRYFDKLVVTYFWDRFVFVFEYVPDLLQITLVYHNIIVGLTNLSTSFVLWCHINVLDTYTGSVRILSYPK